MPLLSASELASMRTEQSASLPDTCTIQSKTTVNTQGSWADTFADAYTAVPCRLSGISSGAVERELGAAQAEVVTHVLTVAHDQTVNATDRVVHNGITYEVVAAANADASWKTARRVWLKIAQ